MKHLKLFMFAFIVLITMGAHAETPLIDSELDGNTEFAKEDESLDSRRIDGTSRLSESLGSALGVQTVQNKAGSFLYSKPRDVDLAEVVIKINSSKNYNDPDAQTMKVYHYGELIRSFKISTGASGYSTPLGYYRPIYTNHMRIYKDYFSGTYSGAAMKWAVFFNGGIAIHSTPKSNYKKLGRAASHGCVRMKMEDAKWVNELIRSSGSQNTVMRKWRHGKHQNTNLWNEYYKGSEIEVQGIDRVSGRLTGNYIKSVDTVIIVTK